MSKGGPLAVDARSIAALRRLQWRVRGQRVATSLTGDHRSIFRGRGMEFDQVVRFEFGDDIRDVDWNVTARLGEVYRKTFVDDREMSVVVVFADDPALQFGSGGRAKRDILLELTGLAILLSALNRYRITVAHDRPDGLRVFAPTRSRERVLATINSLFETAPPAPLTQGGARSPDAWRWIPRGALMLWMGDVPDVAPPLEWRGWARRRAAIGFRVEDAWERSGPPDEALAAYDPVAGRVVTLQDDARTRGRHAAWRAAREARWQAWWPSPTDRLCVGPDEDPLEALVGLILARRGPSRVAR